MAKGARVGLSEACGRWSVLVFWLVREPYLRFQNLPEIHGKEKVYGSIP